MITNVSTPPARVPLAERPESRAAAENMLRAFATGSAVCTDDDESVRQYGRILSVMLWHDVDQTDFALLVEDVAKLAQITAGVPLDDLFGDDETDEKRGEWMFYYETQINWRVNTILDTAGYGQ